MTDDDLTAAVARLRDDISPGYPRTGWHDDVRLILSALEAAQADAARYRWLRDKARSEGRDGGWTGIYTLPVVPAWDETSFAAARHEAFHHKTLDAAIDAAIVKMKP